MDELSSEESDEDDEDDEDDGDPTPEALEEELEEEEEGEEHGVPDERELFVGVDPPEAIAEEIAEEKEAAPRHEERLQKILAHAGVASRRHAEELIAEGKVQVNGQVITTPGHKADPTRDHIRVDGKLLQGSERLRYFVLNKPRGFVTTVSDPEGRPTVMQFFERQSERLYPVGRLDYQSEGLLLVTNDGPLANQLTRAASGVEKTYLVKVSGSPSEEAIERLRKGLTIAKGKPSEGRVRTAPARIRLVRAGENPWYEIVLIEGRNRELRKMFEEVGHRVEKIRRVAYGPLVLDIDAGTMRELNSDEVGLLHLAAKGKFKSRKIDFSVLLPKEAGRSVDHEAAKERLKRPYGKNFRFQGRSEGQGPRDKGPGRSFGPRTEGRPAFGQGRPDSRPDARRGAGPGDKPFRRAEGREDRPFTPRSGGPRREGGPPRGETFGRTREQAGENRVEKRPFERKPNFRIEPADGPAGRTGGFDRGAERSSDRPERRPYGDRPARQPYGDRPERKPEGRAPGRYQDRGESRGSGGRSFGPRSGGPRSEGPRSAEGRGTGERSFRERPSGERGGASFRPGGRSGERTGDRPGGFGAGRTGSGPRREGGGERGGERRGGFGERREGSGGKTFGSRPTGRPAGRSDGPRSGFKPGGRSAGESGEGSGFKSGFKPGGRPAGKSFGKPGFKSSGPKAGGRPGGKPGFKSGSKPGFKSGPKSGGKRPGTNRGRGRDI